MKNIITIENYENEQIGSKAERLFKMKTNGINVPDFICIRPECSLEDLIAYLSKSFGEYEYFSVRSSASAEDGSEYSFAGQFNTYLNVPFCEVYNYAQQCFRSVNNNNVRQYCKNAGIDYSGINITVVIQKMVNAELSGVIFTANPQGILNETVIAVGKGTGNNVVEDKTPVTQYYYNTTDDVCYYETQDGSPVLDKNAVNSLINVSNKIREVFGGYPDIEFAMANGIIYILQARPITSLKSDNTLVILDSSNISESYPGISSPMTISFVKEVYSLVFKSCIRRLTKNDGTAEKLETVLSNMTDSANGRIYYRISCWYDVIMLLPFSSKIIPIWQEMLGVKEKCISNSSDKAGVMTKIRVFASFIQLIFTNERKMEKLNKYFSEKFSCYEDKLQNTEAPEELLEIYSGVRDALSSVWDLTLVNDMYTFIFTGLLKNSLKRSNPENYSELTNICISGISGIESMKPLKMLEAIKSQLKIENRLEELKSVNDINSYIAFIDKGGKAAKLMTEYISLYGDRCPGELKLETLTCRTNPELLAKQINEFDGIAQTALNAQPKLRGFCRIYAEKASAGIMLRERSRVARGRIFGLVRGIILKISESLFRQERIEHIKDVFYLTFDELKQAVYDERITLKELIDDRKAQENMFEKLPAYSRIIFSGTVFDKHPMNVNSEKICLGDKCLHGIPCSSGIVEGEVLMVSDMTSDINAEGKILAARMTDPGWVFLMTQAKGIISEKGSLLSHTAIISRELKKPAVVGVAKAFDLLHDGDYVRIDGDSGKIKILKRRSEIEKY